MRAKTSRIKTNKIVNVRVIAKIKRMWYEQFDSPQYVRGFAPPLTPVVSSLRMAPQVTIPGDAPQSTTVYIF